MPLDRDAARSILADGDIETTKGLDELVDALEGCVQPTPAQTVDRDALVTALSYFENPQQQADRVLALLRPPDGVTLTGEEAHLVANFVRDHVDIGWADPEWPTDAHLSALADRLEAAS